MDISISIDTLTKWCRPKDCSDYSLKMRFYNLKALKTSPIFQDSVNYEVLKHEKVICVSWLLIGYLQRKKLH